MSSILEEIKGGVAGLLSKTGLHLTDDDSDTYAIPTKTQLIEKEADIGAMIFHDPADPHRTHDFFYLDNHTWVWIERWVNAAGQTEEQVTRYEVRSGMIVKIQGSKNYEYASREESLRLLHAVEEYHHRVVRHVYSVPLNSRVY